MKRKEWLRICKGYILVRILRFLIRLDNRNLGIIKRKGLNLKQNRLKLETIKPNMLKLTNIKEKTLIYKLKIRYQVIL